MEKIFWGKLQLKTFMAVMLLNLVVVIAVSVFFQQRSLSYIETEFTAALYTQALEAGTRLDDAYKSLYQSSVDAAFDARLKELIRAGDNRKIAALLREYKNKNPLIDRVSLYFLGAHTLVRSDEYQEIIRLADSTAWENILKSQTGRTPLKTSDMLGPSPKNIYVYSQPIFADSGELIAYIAVAAGEQKLYYEYLDRLNDGENKVYLYTLSGELMGNNADNILADNIAANPEGELSFTADDEKRLAVWLELPFSRTIFCLTKSQAVLNDKIMNMQLLCVLGAIILLLLSSVLLFMISEKLAAPVERLADTMQRVGAGDLAARAEVSGSGEIAYLAASFNKMLDRMDKLVKILANEQAKKRLAEINALQYQIRPHFIYNVLNAIRFAATLQGAKSISDRLADFVEVLRASTNRQGSFVKLSEEIAVLKHYIALQEFRLLDVFEVKFSIEEKAKDLIVPRMLLQPLVENSILHGPSEERPYLHIEVRAEISNDKLILTVHDDGQGMSESAIAEVLAGKINELSHGGLSGIGITNIIERLRLYYNDGARLSYESDGKSYTLAKIILPLSTDMHEYEI